MLGIFKNNSTVVEYLSTSDQVKLLQLSKQTRGVLTPLFLSPLSCNLVTLTTTLIETKKREESLLRDLK